MYLLILLPHVIATDYTLYKVTAFNSIERSILYQIHFKSHYFYFVNGVTNEAIIPIDIIVEGSRTKTFERLLLKNNIQFSKFSPDYVYEIVITTFDIIITIIHRNILVCLQIPKY